jgi:hypothetical protein
VPASSNAASSAPRIFIFGVARRRVWLNNQAA